VVKDSGEDPQAVRNQLSRWVKRGMILPLRKGLYTFHSDETESRPNVLYLANRLYEPSYVSLEYALSIYELIPDYVPVVTSVTTRKTLKLINTIGTFTYQHVLPQAFRGFVQDKQDGGQPVLTAEPEKAVLDFLYFNLHRVEADARGVMLESFRFQNLDSLKPERVLELVPCFRNAKILRTAEVLIAMIEAAKK
jgi:hypothetical protein